MEALQAATRNPAIMTGRAAEWGTIEHGKRANLVLLEADPISDIRNVKRVESVILRGELLTKPELANMLENVAEKARSLSEKFAAGR
jgi:imidazolonepropionase-like amidohydrolase